MESSNSKERELQLTQRLVKQRHSHCMAWFEQLETHLRDLYLNSSSHAVDAFKPAFHSFFGEEHQTFRLKMFHNLDQLRLQLERENLLEVNPRTCLDALRTLFKEFFASKRVNSSEHLNQCWQKDFKEYTFCEPDTYRRDLLENLDTLEAVIHRAVITYGRLDSYCTVDNNTTPDSTNMCHRGGEIDQDAEQYKVKSPLLNTELVKSKEMIEKETYNELSNRFLQLEKHCISLEISMQQKEESSDSGKVFANVALKNELRKLKGNSMDTKFAKPSILGKPVLQPPRNQSVVRQPNAFKSKRPNFSKPSQEESYGSNDMAHNHYLEEARKKTQERNRNSKPSVMHTTSLQNTTNGSKPNPRSNNQLSRSLPVSKSSCEMSNGVSLVDHSRNSSSYSDSKHFVCSTCHKCVFNANHDNCITKFLKEVNSRAKVQSPKTRNNNKPVEPKSHTQKPGRQVVIKQRFSLNKSSDVHEKPNTPRSCLRCIPTGRIFKLTGLRWIPTGKMFIDITNKVDSEPPNGSNEDITNPYECDQTLNVSAGTLNLSAVQASLFNDKMTFEQNGSSLVLQSFMTSVHISSGLALQQHMASADNTSGPAAQRKESSGPGPQLLTPRTISSGLVPQPPSPTPNVPPTKNDWDLLFFLMFDEYLNPLPSVVQHVLVAVVQEPVVSTGTPSSTRIDQDTPSTKIHEFEHLEIWKLVPRPDQVTIVTLNWIYKVKLDELGAGRYLLQTLGQEKLEFLMKKVGMQSMSPKMMKKLEDETEELWCYKDGMVDTVPMNPARAEDLPRDNPTIGFNSLVYSFRALSTLRCSSLRMASAAAKTCQGDSSEFYLIIGRIPTVAAAGQRHVNSKPHAHTSYS
ncbi:hypothetical protein Tco_0156386 [Tanacetum coccineum]